MRDGELNRRALVTRHNVRLDRYDPRELLQVGNGRFAFAVDATGLQTFTLEGGTFSDWCWHTFPNPQGYREEETLREISGGGGRKVLYACGGTGPRSAGAFDWYRRSPHRMHLGRIGFEFIKTDGSLAQVTDLTTIRQDLDLWRGLVTSSFQVEGIPVTVCTCCHPRLDLVAVRAQSALIAQGRLRVFWHFPYVESSQCGPTWNAETDARHSSQILRQQPHRVDLARQLDADRHFVSIAWSDGAWRSSGPHRFVLTPSQQSEQFGFSSAFGLQPPDALPDYESTAAEAARHWQAFWESGAAVDLSASQDPRWHELERRVVLAQYLTAVNSAGATPPQESGLFSNSWYGKFHLEMTAWHGTHFVLWGRAKLVDGWMQWLRGPGLQAATQNAARQGYRGARWMKMVDPVPRWDSPSHWSPFRVTQQAHPLWWAELMYRERPSRQTLTEFAELVMASAEFMADFVWWDGASRRYMLGPPLISGAEGSHSPDAWNPTSDLNYWAMGLEIALSWRQRLGLPAEKKWAHVLAHLSRPPVRNGVYIDAESHPETWSRTERGVWLRPAWFEAYGCIRGPLIEPAVMETTYQRAAAELRSGEWGAGCQNLWGCDYAMLAMTAARLGRPEEAVDWLLTDAPQNAYQRNGFNNGGSRPYLPALGGLLWAVALMAAGWEGAPAGRLAPGFPGDGRWNVAWEHLRPAL